MNSSPLSKGKIAFHKGKYDKIYMRDNEISCLKSFLKSNDNIVHVCGNPGTGKTCTVLSILKNKKYIYINCLENIDEIDKISDIKNEVIVIDEFDHVYNNKKKRALEIFDFIERHNKKLITISNSLDLYENIIFFKVYTFEEILYIIKNKIKDEVGTEIATDLVLSIIAKKFSGNGDIRRTFEYIKNLMDKKLNDSHEKLEIGDIYESKENIDNDENLQHKIIKRLVNSKEKMKKSEIFEFYLKECKELGIPYLNRNDFIVIYEMYSI